MTSPPQQTGTILPVASEEVQNADIIMQESNPAQENDATQPKPRKKPLDFKAFEYSCFEKYKSQLKCPNGCPNSWRNEGVGGTTQVGGFKKIQVSCLKCRSKKRLDILLKESQLGDALTEYNEKYQQASKEGLERQKPQKTLSTFFAEPSSSGNKKRKATQPASNEADVPAPSTSSTQPTNPPPSFQFPAADPVKENLELKEKNRKLEKALEEAKAEIAALSKLKEEIETLKAAITRLEKGKEPIRDTVPPKSILKKNDTNQAKKKLNPLPQAPPTAPAAPESEPDARNLEGNSQTWAQIAKKSVPGFYQAAPQKKNYKTLAKQLMTTPEAPKNFCRLWIKIKDSCPLKHAPSYQEKLNTCWAFLASLELRKSVMEISLIGNQLIEAYVITDRLANFEEVMAENDIEIVHDLDLFAVPEHTRIPGPEIEKKVLQRLGRLYRRARLLNLKTAILENLTELQAKGVKEQADPRLALSRSPSTHNRSDAMEITNETPDAAGAPTSTSHVESRAI